MATDIADIKEKRELVGRVANSPTFQRSPRLREFLVYVADCTISDRLEGTREQQIAANVFNRKPDYNPGQDNIVRVEARSLRKRLEVYFATEGRDEPVIISMPKGSYSICFETRPTGFENPAPMEISYRTPDALPIAPPVPIVSPVAGASAVPIPSRGSPWLVRVLSAIIIALLGLVVVQWQSKRPEKTIPRHTPALILPFSALIDAAKDTYIVTSDSCLVLIEELRQRRISLDDYITGRYVTDTHAPGPERQDLIRLLLQRRYTNAPETGIAVRIIQRNSWDSEHMFLRSGHGVQLADFKNHNVILFGSVTSNPWAALFSEKLNFQFDWDQVRRGLYRNRSPRAGEQAVYSMSTFPGESGNAYAEVAFVPNVNGEGNVLLINGTTAEGTEAAGEFITDEKRAGAALKAMGIDPAGPPRYFEILLEAKAVAGSASQSRILATRLIPDTK
jgi:hypothetical protein